MPLATSYEQQVQGNGCTILGDPGATSRCDIFGRLRHFWRESLRQGLKSPWALFLTKQVPEVVEIRPADYPEIFFLANQRGGLAV